MTKETIKHDKASRIDRAKGRTRGQFLSLLQKHEMEDDTYSIVASENEALVSDADVAAWLEENDFIGTVYPVRFARGSNSVHRHFTRERQETFSIKRG